MLKIIRMVSLFALAAAISEPSLNVPPQLLLGSSPIHHVMVSAYTDHPVCTASRNSRTASGRRISAMDYGKLVALSPDLGKQHRFGDAFSLWVRGKEYTVSYQDRMPKKQRQKVDLLLPSLGACRQFGRSPGILIPRESA